MSDKETPATAAGSNTNDSCRRSTPATRVSHSRRIGTAVPARSHVVAVNGQSAASARRERGPAGAPGGSRSAGAVERHSAVGPVDDRELSRGHPQLGPAAVRPRRALHAGGPARRHRSAGPGRVAPAHAGVRRALPRLRGRSRSKHGVSAVPRAGAHATDVGPQHAGAHGGAPAHDPVQGQGRPRPGPLARGAVRLPGSDGGGCAAVPGGAGSGRETTRRSTSSSRATWRAGSTSASGRCSRSPNGSLRRRERAS